MSLVVGLLGLFLIGFTLDVFSGSSDEPEHTVEGDDEANSLTGTSGDDLLLGEGGDDTLNGYSGDDILEGGAGDDQLYAGSGHDLLIGGDGNDLLQSGFGQDELYGEAGNDNLNGGVGDDILSGDEGADSLNGGNGNDILYGIIDANEDYFFDATDTDGADLLAGGHGDDVLFVGSGDEAFGGGGTDTYVTGTWVDPANPPTINYHRADDDILVITYDPAVTASEDLDIVEIDDYTSSVVFNGQVVMDVFSLDGPIFLSDLVLNPATLS